MQAVAVDGRRREEHDDDLARQPQDLVVERLTPRPGEALGVVEAGEGFAAGLVQRRVVEADGGGGERAGETAAAGLVGAGDGRAVRAGGREVEGEALVHGRRRHPRYSAATPPMRPGGQ